MKTEGFFYNSTSDQLEEEDDKRMRSMLSLFQASNISFPREKVMAKTSLILAAWIIVNIQMHYPLIIFWVLRPVYLYLFQMGSFVDRQPSRLHENSIGNFLQDIQ